MNTVHMLRGVFAYNDWASLKLSSRSNKCCERQVILILTAIGNSSSDPSIGNSAVLGRLVLTPVLAREIACLYEFG